MRDLNDYQCQYGDYPFENILLKYRKKKIIEKLNEYKPKRILEIGCGNDPLFLHYNKFDEFCIVEPSTKFFENAVKVAGTHDNKDRIVIRNKFLENDLDFLKDKNFDFVILAGLLHEVESPRIMLESVHRIINEDSILHINVPNAHSLHRIIALHAGLIGNVCDLSDFNKRFQQNTVFHLDQIKLLLEQNGFEVLGNGTIFVKPFTHSQMQKLIDLKILDDVIIEGLYNATKSFPDLGCEIYINAKIK
jgi:SAM-dependent methyltransferase